MLQLASTCEAMGIPKDTVKTLRRWDRVHMIKELAGVAVGTVPIVGLHHLLRLVSFCLLFLVRLHLGASCPSGCFVSSLTFLYACIFVGASVSLIPPLPSPAVKIIVQLNRTDIVFSGGRKRERSEHLRAVRAKEAAQRHHRQGPLPGVSMTYQIPMADTWNMLRLSRGFGVHGQTMVSLYELHWSLGRDIFLFHINEQSSGRSIVPTTACE